MKKMLLFLVLSLIMIKICYAQEMNLMWYKDNFYYRNYAISDDGKYAVFTSWLTGTSRPIIYNMQTGKMVSHLQTGMPDFLGFLSNNEILLSYQSSTDSEKALIRYNIEDTNSFISYHHKDSIFFAYLGLPQHLHKNYWLTPDKSKLYVIKDAQTIDVFDLINMTLEKTINHEQTYGKLQQLTISHDSKLIAYGFEDAIEIRDFSTGELKKVIKTPTWQYSVLLFSPDSKRILTNDLSNGLFFYDVASGDSIGFFPIEKMILYDYDIYPYTNKMLIDRNYILNFDSMKVDTLPITIFITDTTGPIKWRLVGFGSNNKLKVIDGKNYYYTSIIGILNSAFIPQGWGLYLRDSTGKIMKEYYNYQTYVGINKENNALIFEPWWYRYY
jgi:WD40 repeat protein